MVSETIVFSYLNWLAQHPHQTHKFWWISSPFFENQLQEWIPSFCEKGPSSKMHLCTNVTTWSGLCKAPSQWLYRHLHATISQKHVSRLISSPRLLEHQPFVVLAGSLYAIICYLITSFSFFNSRSCTLSSKLLSFFGCSINTLLAVSSSVLKAQFSSLPATAFRGSRLLHDFFSHSRHRIFLRYLKVQFRNLVFKEHWLHCYFG